MICILAQKAAAFTQASQALIEGPADLGGVPDSFDFWPGDAAAFPSIF